MKGIHLRLLLVELKEEQAVFGGRRFLGVASTDEDPLSEREHVSRGQS
jgi:hypothetical protein